MDQGHQNQSKFQSPKEVIIMQCFTDNIRTYVKHLYQKYSTIT